MPTEQSRSNLPVYPNTQTVVARAKAAAATWDDASVIPFLQTAIRGNPADAMRRHMLGLAWRNLDHHVEAIDCFRDAARLAPSDALIAHALARTTLEAGLPALSLFDRALALAPLNAEIILGRVAAQFAQSGANDAIADLRTQLAVHPAWYEGHATAARLLWLAGEQDRSGETFEAALAERPRDGLLWREYALVALRAGDHARLASILMRARSAVGVSRTLDLIEAASLSETGDTTDADSIFARHGPIGEDFVGYHARNLLRAGRPDAVSALMDSRAGSDIGRELLPLALLAWRQLGDPRYDQLMRGTDFVRVFDLASELGSMDALTEALRAVHRASHAPLDQSLRKGTQTDGPLFSRLDPAIRALRKVILDAVGRYVSDLPELEAAHPLLGERRKPLRFAGSWSVRLTDGGHHVDHVHLAGWISSAFYVAVPDTDDVSREGWLALGDAPSLGLPESPIAEIKPQPGRLVLFPSFMWHRTRPFSAGERLTVAFDMARAPR